MESAPPCVKSGSAAMIELVSQKLMVIEEFNNYPLLGSFAFREKKQSLSVDLIKEVVIKALVGKKGNKEIKAAAKKKKKL